MMRTQRFALPPEWSAAIRDEAHAYGTGTGTTIDRAGLSHHLSNVRPVRIRIGWEPPFNPHRPTPSNVVWLEKRPRCLDCGELIDYGWDAVEFKYHRERYRQGRTRYIHQICPEEEPTE